MLKSSCDTVGRAAMRFLFGVALVLPILLSSPSYAACDAQSICSQPTGLVTLAKARRVRNTTDTCISGCRGTGFALFSCRCKCHGTPDFPCHPSRGPRGEPRCLCE